MTANFAEITYLALFELWSGFINFLPTLLGGLIIFFAGLIVASGFAVLVEKIIDLLKIDEILEKWTSLKIFTDRAGVRLDSGYFLGFIVRWLIILAFLMAVADIWGLAVIEEFLRQIINYIPRVIVAVMVMILAVLFGDYLDKIVRASVKAGGLKAAKSLGSLARWSVLIFGLAIAIPQLGVGGHIIQTLITGLVAMIAIAGGIAFGLGGKELAQEILVRLREKIGD